MSSVQLYAQYMKLAKIRLTYIASELNKDILSTIEIENVALQLRHLVELVSFSALSNSRQEYEQAFGELQGEWRYRRILTRLLELNPKALPMPVVWRRSSSEGQITRHHIDVLRSEVLSIDELENFYNYLSNFLHELMWWSKRTGSENPCQRMAEIAARLANVLRAHLIVLMSREILICDFRHADDDPIVMIAGADGEYVGL